mmetsp:Transcript_1694/g.6761  ORF Transcript_1694/g.6761 Transcript_1694/m.6761 type:complete len:705 (-) Transcript_1694:4040-6154(-)
MAVAPQRRGRVGRLHCSPTGLRHQREGQPVVAPPARQPPGRPAECAAGQRSHGGARSQGLLRPSRACLLLPGRSGLGRRIYPGLQRSDAGAEGADVRLGGPGRERPHPCVQWELGRGASRDAHSLERVAAGVRACCFRYRATSGAAPAQRACCADGGGLLGRSERGEGPVELAHDWAQQRFLAVVRLRFSARGVGARAHVVVRQRDEPAADCAPGRDALRPVAAVPRRSGLVCRPCAAGRPAPQAGHRRIVRVRAVPSASCRRRGGIAAAAAGKRDGRERQRPQGQVGGRGVIAGAHHVGRPNVQRVRRVEQRRRCAGARGGQPCRHLAQRRADEPSGSGHGPRRRDHGMGHHCSRRHRAGVDPWARGHDGSPDGRGSGAPGPEWPLGKHRRCCHDVGGCVERGGAVVSGGVAAVADHNIAGSQRLCQRSSGADLSVRDGGGGGRVGRPARSHDRVARVRGAARRAGGGELRPGWRQHRRHLERGRGLERADCDRASLAVGSDRGGRRHSRGPRQRAGRGGVCSGLSSQQHRGADGHLRCARRRAGERAPGHTLGGRRRDRGRGKPPGGRGAGAAPRGARRRGGGGCKVHELGPQHRVRGDGAWYGERTGRRRLHHRRHPSLVAQHRGLARAGQRRARAVLGGAGGHARRLATQRDRGSVGAGWRRRVARGRRAGAGDVQHHLAPSSGRRGHRGRRRLHFDCAR